MQYLAICLIYMDKMHSWYIEIKPLRIFGKPPFISMLCFTVIIISNDSLDLGHKSVYFGQLFGSPTHPYSGLFPIKTVRNTHILDKQLKPYPINMTKCGATLIKKCELWPLPYLCIQCFVASLDVSSEKKWGHISRKVLKGFESRHQFPPLDFI